MALGLARERGEGGGAYVGVRREEREEGRTLVLGEKRGRRGVRWC
jgi:hypothetical protein